MSSSESDAAPCSTPPARSRVVPLALTCGLLALGLTWPLPSYLVSYRPARKAYDAKADEVERQVAERKQESDAWLQIGQITLDAGEVELANTAINAINEQTGHVHELKDQLLRSPERAGLAAASDAFRRHYAIGAALVAMGLVGAVVIGLRLRMLGGALTGVFGGAFLVGLAGYLWWRAPSPLGLPFGVGEIVLPALIAGGLVGLSSAMLAARVGRHA